MVERCLQVLRYADARGREYREDVSRIGIAFVRVARDPFDALAQLLPTAGGTLAPLGDLFGQHRFSVAEVRGRDKRAKPLRTLYPITSREGITMHRKSSLFALVSAALAGGFASQASGSGFALQEQGASGLGNAYAGAAAVAEDATTVWWNPAGMARLGPGKHLSIGATYIAPSTKFTDTGSVPAALSNPARNGNGGDAGQAKAVPSLFFAVDVTPEWNFGIGISVPFGLATTYDSDWIGRFQGIESKVETLNLNPVLSFKASEHVSIGGGVSYQEGKVDLLSAVNYS